MLGRIHTAATFLWSALAGGAGAGFLAREALGLRQPLVALAWLIGAAIPVAVLARRCCPPARRSGPFARRCPLALRPRARDRRRRLADARDPESDESFPAA